MEFSLAIFDLGNTLFRTDWDKPFQIWSSATGLSEAELKSRYVWDHPTFELFQRGEVSAQQFHSHVCELLQTSLSYEDFVRGWTSIYAELYDDVVNAIANLKADIIRVAYTNTDSIHETIWLERYWELSRIFARVYISSRLGFRKPEPRGFKHILDEWQVKAERAVFFDDDPTYADAAKALGITAVLVHQPQDVVRSLIAFNMLT